ncbi:hypothetical protein BDC45DRAFT_497515 [Circinella umbellata]|nr:hypothetical protein BDC45DRAFT_497515 [Circinella umbellata]
MYRATLLLLIVCFLLNVSRAIDPTSLPVPSPGQPTDVVCIQIICPDPGVDPNHCPERCHGKCRIIENACCPESQIAVCADDPDITSGLVPTSSGGDNEPTGSVTALPTESGSASDGGSTAIGSSSGTSSSPNPDTTTNPESSSNGLKLPYFVAPLFIILITKLLFL